MRLALLRAQKPSAAWPLERPSKIQVPGTPEPVLVKDSIPILYICQLPDGVRTNGVVADVPQFPTTNFHG